jgi:iodotyrosine deiodinase
MADARTIPYRGLARNEEEAMNTGRELLEVMQARRSVREFSPRPVSRDLIETAVAVANTAPSGAHQQPWTFVAVGDPEVKRAIRVAAEAEEAVNYHGGRLPPAWREAIAPLGTDADKPFLEIAPWLVVVFAQKTTPMADGTERKN